jgi:hypothetical protein
MSARRAVLVGAATVAASFLLVSSVPATARTPATIRAEYTFNSIADGQVDDASGRGHHLTLSGNYNVAVGPTSPAVAFAPISRAATPHLADLNPGGREFASTVVFRIPAETIGLSDTPNLAQKGFFNDPGQWKMQLKPDVAAVQCRFKGTLAAELVTSSVTGVDDGAWHTATCWRSQSQVGVTVDGADVAISTNVGDISNTRPLLIGAKSLSSSTDQFTGEIDYMSLAVGGAAAVQSRSALDTP